MANICNNKFYFQCNHNAHKYLDIFEDMQEDSYGDFQFTIFHNDGNQCSVEGEFVSKWIFPIDTFKSLFTEVSDECYFRCLSEEYANGYVAMNIYKDGKWLDEQTFNIV